MISNRILFLALLQLSLAGCEETADDFVPLGDSSYALLPRDKSTYFHVDSVIYDPIAGGTSRTELSREWVVRPLNTAATDALYIVSVEDSSRRQLASLLWNWSVEAGRVNSTLDGLSYTALTWPFRVGTSWDPLASADRGTIVAVAGEPIELYKNWESTIDSLGSYTLPDGTAVDAVWITHADRENLIELREASEIYGAGQGLLERHLRILNTQQNTSDAPWEEKAETGFSLDMVRSR